MPDEIPARVLRQRLAAELVHDVQVMLDGRAMVEADGTGELVAHDRGAAGRPAQRDADGLAKTAQLIVRQRAQDGRVERGIFQTGKWLPAIRHHSIHHRPNADGPALGAPALGAEQSGHSAALSPHGKKCRTSAVSYTDYPLLFRPIWLSAGRGSVLREIVELAALDPARKEAIAKLTGSNAAMDR